MNMSFINRASPHEVLSFFTQPIYPSAKDWLTMDAVQSAIMTSSLINLPLAEREPYLQFSPHTHRHVHTHTHETAVSAISRHFFFFLFPGIMGKFLAAGNGFRSMAVLVGRQHAGPEWTMAIGWITVTFGADNRDSERIIEGVYCLKSVLFSHCCSNLRRYNKSFVWRHFSWRIFFCFLLISLFTSETSWIIFFYSCYIF